MEVMDAATAAGVITAVPLIVHGRVTSVAHRFMHI